MDDAEIRRFRLDDETTVRALSQRLSEGFAPWRDDAKVEQTISGWIETAFQNSATDGHTLMVAVQGDEVVGFVAVEAKDHYIDGRDAYIGELVVAAHQEGRGIGQKLLSAASEWGREQGCERLTLQTGAANARARSFYEKLGFDYEDVSMARPL